MQALRRNRSLAACLVKHEANDCLWKVSPHVKDCPASLRKLQSGGANCPEHAPKYETRREHQVLLSTLMPIDMRKAARP